MAGVFDSRRPHFVADDRDGFSGVEARILVGDEALVVTELRVAPGGRIPDHPADEDVHVACVEGSGWSRVAEVDAPFAAGQWTKWPANEAHGLRAGPTGMRVLIVHPRPA